MHPIQWKKKMSCCYYCTTSTHSEVAGVVLWRENGEGREKLSESKKGAGKVSDWLEEQGSNMKWLWLQSPPFPRILQYLIVISFPWTSYATPCIHHMRYNEIKTRYIHNNVHISTEVSCRGVFQTPISMKCHRHTCFLHAPTIICVSCILILSHHLFCLNSNHPQRTKIISPLLWCYLFRHTARVPSWSLTFFHNIVFAYCKRLQNRCCWNVLLPFYFWRLWVSRIMKDMKDTAVIKR